ncbi:MAG TPA: ATP-binding cassette domain-containing protein [Polyangiaceae bacterium]|jgi:multiple sugar transport system ATP-binding protein|nr:ATP-binding cassette domain-containing protein [Polyangiaceae bacterium]
MPAVSFSNVTHEYGQHRVLQDLNLDVQDGEFLVLLGPSGCGKTTLLHLLAGLQEVSAGSIHIGGRDVTELEPKDRGLAMVFQSYALYPTKSVEGNLKFGLAAQRLPRSEVDKRVRWAAKLLRLEGLLGRKPAELSGGQRQRVAIGRALVKQVGLFLFDEPLSNLDAKLRTEMRLEIKRIHAELGNTVVYVTHDQVEAMTMATRIAVMNDGVIQQIATPDEIYAAPANTFVAAFIGSPPMNLLDAEVSHVGEKVTAVHRSTETRMELSHYAFARRPRPGQRIQIGMRPEHFVVGQAPGLNPAASFALPLAYAEKIGDRGVAFLKLGEGLLAAGGDFSTFRAPAAGETVEAHFPGDRFSIFDSETGARM